ncbi:MAG TPA: hypothetical protein VHV83_12520 [Armatimonadota bacterium]|nr:hypothetical protein [Armatimonadota bacterium]
MARFLLVFLVVLLIVPACADITVTIDPAVQYQTILGWGASSGPLNVSPYLRDQVLDAAVNELGLTRLRIEIDRRGWEGPLNDDADPFHINWTAFKTAATDEKMLNTVVPFKQRVEANGDTFYAYVSPSFFQGGSTGDIPQWMLDNPDEYAEWAIAYLLYIKQKYGITPQHFSICNEAGNNNRISPQVIAKMITAMAPRLQAAGLSTKYVVSEGVNAGVTWSYINWLEKNAPGVWPYVSLISYHLYGDRSQRQQIYEFAKAKGIPTAETEYMGTTIKDLYEDLTLGGVSFWEHYVLAGPWDGNGTYIRTNICGDAFTRYVEYWNFRQVMHYVRPGAVRVKAESDDPTLRTVAFSKGGKMTVVLISKGVKDAQTVKVAGLPDGSYGVCRTVQNRPYQETGVQQAAGGSFTVNLPAETVLTIYPYSGVNQPPTITEWQANPAYLEPPTTQVTLTAQATDAEIDPLTFAWEVENVPAGATVALETPTAARTKAMGLTIPGEYLFKVTVSDQTHKVSREVKVIVYPGNQPPEIMGMHNRFPVTMILPITQTMLVADVRDLENDQGTFLWSVIQQPDGANATFEKPTAKRTKVSGLTVAGDYTFRFTVQDVHHTVAQDYTVTVYPGLTRQGLLDPNAPKSVPTQPAADPRP